MVVVVIDVAMVGGIGVVVALVLAASEGRGQGEGEGATSAGATAHGMGIRNDDALEQVDKAETVKKVASPYCAAGRTGSSRCVASP